jgi:hypothetical protein
MRQVAGWTGPFETLHLYAHCAKHFPAVFVVTCDKDILPTSATVLTLPAQLESCMSPIPFSCHRCSRPGCDIAVVSQRPRAILPPNLRRQAGVECLAARDQILRQHIGRPPHDNRRMIARRAHPQPANVGHPIRPSGIGLRLYLRTPIAVEGSQSQHPHFVASV